MRVSLSAVVAASFHLAGRSSKSWQLVATMSISICPIFSDCTVTQRESAQGKEVTLENEFMRVVVQPDLGANCSSIFFKTANAELTRSDGYGALEDRRWGGPRYENMRQYSYSYRIVSKGPDEASVTLATQCRVPGFTKLSIEKTLSLTKGGSALKVQYRMTNGSQVTLPLGWWCFTDLGMAGRDNTIFIPHPMGVERTLSPVHGKQRSETSGKYQSHFMYDLPRGWVASIEEGKAGVAVSFDVRKISFAYTFYGGGVRTLEWAFNGVSLEAGKSHEIEFNILPVFGLPTVDGAADDLVGSLSTGRPGALGRPTLFERGQKIPIQVSLSGAKQESVRSVTDVRILPDGEWKRIDKRTLSLKPATAFKYSLERLPDDAGTHVLRCRIFRGQKQVFDMERPLIVGKSSATYAFKPNHKPIGKVLSKYRPRKASKASRRTVGHLPEDYQPSQKVITSHVKWARPWAGGKAKILIAIHHRIIRQVVELAQRADIDYECVAMNTYSGKYSGPEILLLAEKTKAAKYDVLVLGSSEFDRLPEGLQMRIAQQIAKGGKGIVFAGPVPSKFPETREKVVTPFARGTLPQMHRPGTFEVGKGRMATLPYAYNRKGGMLCPNRLRHSGYVKPILDFFSPEFDFEEYAYALTARAILWAAGREPELNLRFEVNEKLAAMDGGALTVFIENAGKTAMAGRMSARIADGYSTTLSEITRDVSSTPGRSHQEFKLVPLPSGSYVADVWLKDREGRIINWASTSFRVRGDVSFEETKFDRELYSEGDAVRLKVKLRFNPAFKDDLAIRWELFGGNSENRMVGRGKASFEILEEGVGVSLIEARTVRPVERFREFRLFAERNGKPVAQTRTGVFVKPMPRPGWFHAIGYGRMGTDLHSYSRSASPQPVYLENSLRTTRQGFFTFAPIGAGIASGRIQRGAGGLVRPICFTDLKFLEYAKAGIDQFAKVGRLQENLGASVSDEWGYGGEGNVPSDYCRSPSCLAGFRKFLQSEYPNLDALNRTWRAAYKSWDEIVPPTFKASRESGSWERWVDHRRFVESVVAGYFNWINNHARAKYAAARLGLSGTPNAGSFNGYDWARLMKTMPCIASYGGPQLNIIRSLKRPDMFFVRWAGYDPPSKNEKGHRAAPWRALFDELDGLAYYVTSGYSPLYNPDGTHGAKAKWIGDEWADLRSGIAAIIRNAKREPAPVALHYSQSSIHCATSQGRYGQYNSNLSSTMALLSDIGCLYDFVSYDQVERDRLDSGKVFYLPYSQALSPKEVERIAEFVRRGGTLIADVYPAVRDHHGHAHARGALDEVFGVRSDPKSAPVFQMTSIEGEGLPQNVQLQSGSSGIKTDAGIAMARLPDLDNAPAWIENSFGHGKAILLNFSLAGYSAYQSGGTGGEIDIVKRAKAEARTAIQSIGRRLLERASVKRAVIITRADGTPFTRAHVVPFRQGSALHVGVLPGWDNGFLDPEKDTTKVTIDFGAPYHIHELRFGRNYGKQRAIQTELIQSTAQIFALLPEKPAPIKFEFAEPPSRENGAAIHLSTTDQGFDRIVHLKVIDPNGKSTWLYSRDIIIKDGTAKWTIPIALNAPAGEWKVSVQDPIRGEPADLVFVLP